MYLFIYLKSYVIVIDGFDITPRGFDSLNAFLKSVLRKKFYKDRTLKK